MMKLSAPNVAPSMASLIRNGRLRPRMAPLGTCVVGAPCPHAMSAGRGSPMPDHLDPFTKADLLPRLPGIFIANVRRDWDKGLFDALSTGILAVAAMWQAASS